MPESHVMGDEPAFRGAYTDLEERIDAFMGDPAAESFDRLASDVFQFQMEWNPAYRNFCHSVGETDHAPDGIPPFSAATPVPTEAFKHEDVPVRCFPGGPTEATFLTSGTTGERRGHHRFFSTRLYRRSILAAWESLQLPTLPLLCLTSSPDEAPHSSLCFMMGVLAELSPSVPSPFFVRPTGQLETDRLNRSLGEAPVLIAGTALAFLHLLESGDPPTALPHGSCLLETGGYKGSGRTLSKPDFYGRLSQAFGVPHDQIYNEYSMTELSSQFYAQGVGTPHRGPHWAKATVVNPATQEPVDEGEIGILHITDLANLGSAIGIATQDLAVRRADGFELMGRDPSALPRGCSRAADELLAQPTGSDRTPQ